MFTKIYIDMSTLAYRDWKIENNLHSLQ